MNLKLSIQLCESAVDISKPTWGIRTKPPPPPSSGQSLFPAGHTCCPPPGYSDGSSTWEVEAAGEPEAERNGIGETPLPLSLYPSPRLLSSFLPASLSAPHLGEGVTSVIWLIYQPPLLLPDPPASSLHPSK